MYDKDEKHEITVEDTLEIILPDSPTVTDPKFELLELFIIGDVTAKEE